MTYREEEEYDDADADGDGDDDDDDENFRPNLNVVWDLFPNNERNIFIFFQNKDFSFGGMILNIEAMKHIDRETCQNTNNIVSQRVRHEMLYGSQSIQFDILGFQSINSKYCLLRSRYFWKLI